MLSPYAYIGISLFSAATITLLWSWSRAIADHNLSDLQRRIKTDRNPLISIVFPTYLALIVMDILTHQIFLRLSISLIGASTYLSFCFFSQEHQEGFWSKSRNRLVASVITISSAIILPFFLPISLIAIFYALATYRLNQLNSLRRAMQKLSDYDAIQLKLFSEQARQHSCKIYSQLTHDHDRALKRAG